jgi:uncharacterized protein
VTANAPAAERDVEFQSLGAVLRGRLFVPDVGLPAPVVVMGHGFSATIDGMVADDYARVFRDAGIAALLFDHLGFGRSDGEPRLEINAWLQVHGYLDAVDALADLPEVDAARAGLWGDSMSGAVALVAAALDDRVRAVVVQIPALGDDPPPADPDGSIFAGMRDTYDSGACRADPSDVVGPMAVVSADQLRSPSLLRPITAFRWFIDYGGRPRTTWANSATWVPPRSIGPYEPVIAASHIGVPTLFVIAHDDEMEGANPAVARLAYENLAGPRELLELDGGHFGLAYCPSERFDLASRSQRDFLARFLG